MRPQYGLNGEPGGLDAVCLNNLGLGRRSRSPASVEGRVNTVDKATPDVYWLSEKADGSGVQRALLDGLVGIGRDENNRNVKAVMRQVILQVYPAHFWHLHVQNQASRFPDR